MGRKDGTKEGSKNWEGKMRRMEVKGGRKDGKDGKDGRETWVGRPTKASKFKVS
jgi:hypothetical protein